MPVGGALALEVSLAAAARPSPRSQRRNCAKIAAKYAPSNARQGSERSPGCSAARAARPHALSRRLRVVCGASPVQDLVNVRAACRRRDHGGELLPGLCPAGLRNV